MISALDIVGGFFICPIFIAEQVSPTPSDVFIYSVYRGDFCAVRNPFLTA